VFNGTYSENMTFLKSITLKGEEKSSTIIDGGEQNIAISIIGNQINITGFTIKNNVNGLQILNATNCTIFNNNFEKLITGIFIDNTSADNLIYHNNFLNNSNHAIDKGNNSWDAGIQHGGNYWDNYTGKDMNSDGFGDTQFKLSFNNIIDRYPLISPVTQPPIAAFSHEPSNPYSYDIVQFIDLSVDQDDGINLWYWDFGDGNTTNQQSPTHIYIKQGTYAVNLTVIDHYGVFDQISKTIIIQNVPPTPNFEFAPITPTDLDEIIFSDNSTDIDGVIIGWNWDFGDGNNSSLQNPIHQFADNGTYIITLYVTDDNNATRYISYQIQIQNVPPIAQFNLNPTNPILNDNITFQDSSVDLDGIIIAWNWDFGDDSFSNKQSPIHRYKNQGTYTIILNLVDNDGAQSTIEKTIIIIDEEPAEEVPIVSFLLYSMYVAFFIAMIVMVLYIKKRFG
jgi:PKD repeat protein